MAEHVHRGTRLLLPLAAAICLLVAALAQPSEAAFPGKPGRIAYNAELPGEDQSGGPSPDPPFGIHYDRGFDIFTVNPDGTDTRRLTQNGPEPDSEGSPNWSPEGTLLAFSTAHPFTQMSPYPARPESRLEVMAPDGSGRRVVLASFDGPSDPLFSPNGRRLYYRWSAIDLIQSGVRSVALDGSDRREEDRNLFDSYGPQISPDGRWKVFARQTADFTASDLFMSRLDGSDAQQLTFTPSIQELGPAFAPDASAIVFSAVAPFGPRVITVLDLRSGEQTAISDPAVTSFAPDWGAIPVYCGGRRATLVGTPSKDKLVGTKGRDVIAGLGGKDTLKGKGGRDILCGGKGKDKLIGGKGKKDRCFGGKGRDRAKGCERTKGI